MKRKSAQEQYFNLCDAINDDDPITLKLLAKLQKLETESNSPQLIYLNSDDRSCDLIGVVARNETFAYAVLELISMMASAKTNYVHKILKGQPLTYHHLIGELARRRKVWIDTNYPNAKIKGLDSDLSIIDLWTLRRVEKALSIDLDLEL